MYVPNCYRNYVERLHYMRNTDKNNREFLFMGVVKNIPNVYLKKYGVILII